MSSELQSMTRRRLLAGSLAAGGGLLIAPAGQAGATPPPSTRSPYVINLGDYAKGDGSDETDAIQAAINAIPSSYAEHFGAELYIPRPPKFYGISKTILIDEKWNCTIRCATPAVMERANDTGHNHYFHWLGPDGGLMFRVNACKGLRIEKLSMNGRDRSFNQKYYTGTSKDVTGISFGPASGQAGFTTDIIVDTLSMVHVHDGVRLGEYGNNGPDVRTILFNHLAIFDFANRGVVMESGNLATVTMINPTIYSSRTDGKPALACVESRGGEILILNHNTAGLVESDLSIYAGGIQVVKAWSEIAGIFLKAAGSAMDPDPKAPYYGTVSYPVILEGCRHFSGSPEFLKQVAQSITYDLAVPLHLIGCVFYGDVVLGEQSNSCVVDIGTTFINPASKMTGPGIEKHHRLIGLGTRRPDNARLLEPYSVDRRHVPGVEAPKQGQWNEGDGIINLKPDPKVAAKACRGWVCIESGSPGKWMAYGALID